MQGIVSLLSIFLIWKSINIKKNGKHTDMPAVHPKENWMALIINHSKEKLGAEMGHFYNRLFSHGKTSRENMYINAHRYN